MRNCGYHATKTDDGCDFAVVSALFVIGNTALLILGGIDAIFVRKVPQNFYIQRLQ